MVENISEGEPRPVGRPSAYTPEVAARIFAHLAEGKSLRRVCKMPGMPGLTTFFRWIGDNPEFRKQYEISADARAEAYAEEITEIADDGSNDWMQSNDPDNPGYRLNGEHVQRSRLRVDARKWIASKLKPKKYGDSTHVKLSDPDGGPVTVVQLATTDPAEASRVYQTLIGGK